LSYKDILVFLDDGATNAERVKAAFYLAKAHGANLTGVSLASLKPTHAKASDDKAMTRMAEELAHKLVEEFTQAATQADLAVNTIIIFGDADTSALKMAHYARNFDLVMLRQPNPARDNFSRLQEFAEQTMLHSGRPVFFMPYIGAHHIPCRKAMIAWDGTPTANRAVPDAIPMLTGAKEVIILVVDSKKQIKGEHDMMTENLASHLENHKINVRVMHVNPGTFDIPTTILNEIADNDIDILIMGGYGTPSLQQKIFGGVTRSLLSTMITPVFMSH
jgi:nucleotide-binding universal stress UspA family protein